MNTSLNNQHSDFRAVSYDTQRRGSILTMSALVLVMVFCFAAFAIDIGMIALTKSQMQNTADAAALAAAAALRDRLVDPHLLVSAQEMASENAALVAKYNRSWSSESTDFTSSTDLALGHRYFDKDKAKWVIDWHQTPYNVAQVKLTRSDARGNALHLAFGKFVQIERTGVSAYSTAAVAPVTGITTPPGDGSTSQWSNFLPFTLDLDTWLELEQGLLPDLLSVDSNGAVVSVPDGLSEVAMFPNPPYPDIPAGNRGTLAIGSSENSTRKLVRQILYGLSEKDLDFHGGELSVDDGPLLLEGDPGISAGIERALLSIVGQERVIPIFTEVEGTGGTSIYKIVKFVGVRIMAVDLHGARTQKQFVIQPCTMTLDGGLRGTMPVDPTDVGVVYASQPGLILVDPAPAP